jgi:hypothetical protein
LNGFEDWIEVFRTGEHTASSGEAKLYTTTDLDAIVSKYKVQSDHEAPVTIGHPANDQPAYGWVESLKRSGDVLLAKFKDVSEDFADLVKNGRFKKRSIALYPDMTLRHIAFLGAVPPAVKGLKNIAFADGEYTEHETNYNKKEKSMLTTEELQSQIEKIKSDFEAEKKTNAAFLEKLKAVEEENIALKSQMKNMESSLLASQKATRKAEFQSFCESLESEGRLTPAMKPAALDFMEIMQFQSEYEFAEGGKKWPVFAFQDFLKSLPIQVEFQEVAKKDNAASKTLDQTIRTYMEEHKMDYKTAIIEISKSNPNVFRGA